MTPPTIECSLGDPCGVSAEVLVRSLVDVKAGPVRVHAHADLLLGAAQNLTPGLAEAFDALQGRAWIAAPPAPLPEGAVPTGCYHPAWGAYALRSLEAATRAALENNRALVTGPLSKHSFIDGRVGAVGHTEFLARASGIPEDDVLMLFDGDGLRIATLTRHIPLAAVPGRVHHDAVRRAARLVAGYLGEPDPRIALACLDPHCGEWGGLADTDLSLREALAAAEPRVLGPMAADTLFLPGNLSRFDVILCWYHDQAMIPVKLVAFDTAVNVTLGLPILRTSPAHGPGYDIAGKGIADPGSMQRALTLAQVPSS